MKYSFVALLAAILLFTNTPSPTASPNIPKLLESVRPLQWASTDTNTGEEVIRTHCSISFVNKQQYLWLTAAHCVTGNSPGLLIDGKEADVTFIDVENDLAVLSTARSQYKTIALKLAKNSPWFLTHIAMAGYPWGVGPDIVLGRVANPVETVSSGTTFMKLSISGCPGNSGSPIVNSNNEVVSVLQVGWSGMFPSCSSVMGGVTYDKLVKIVGKYFGK